MEHIKVVEGQIVTTAKFNNTMKSLQKFQIKKQEMDNKETEIRQALQTAMENSGVTHFENDLFSITLTPAHTRPQVDTPALKKDGLYEKYSKEVAVKASTRITYKDAND